ncbi:hypothetical protein GCM10009087_20800 [Sphingomonas oligophenolica]|uniref:Uncharacterized protein n=1 Tax=Sphingomonas oligophenolica TaxID=301154 RepID=A0ABU9Y3Z1_9SPHN
MSAAQEFPVDLPGGPVGQDHGLRWTLMVLGVATASLALTNAVSIESWGADLPPSPGVARVVDDAGRWRATTDSAGLSAPRETLHRAWKRLEEARWPGQPSDELAAR